MVWAWFGHGLGMVWAWFWHGLGMVLAWFAMVWTFVSFCLQIQPCIVVQFSKSQLFVPTSIHCITCGVLNSFGRKNTNLCGPMFMIQDVHSLYLSCISVSADRMQLLTTRDGFVFGAQCAYMAWDFSNAESACKITKEHKFQLIYVCFCPLEIGLFSMHSALTWLGFCDCKSSLQIANAF